MDDVKKRAHELFGTQLTFNKEFDTYVKKLKEGMIEELLAWCERCNDNKELGSVPPKKQHKHLYVFFRKIGSAVRAVLIKEQNGAFTLFILAGHKYYDDTRLHLGYKKSSYYGS
ncbi:MAG: hypothetical protein OXR66_04840 [Candidatus Woesearchaeota archaeon]|nr:hypothetical protein [Candidatus Woesearchaeota archaeon]